MLENGSTVEIDGLLGRLNEIRQLGGTHIQIDAGSEFHVEDVWIFGKREETTVEIAARRQGEEEEAARMDEINEQWRLVNEAVKGRKA